MIPILDLKTQLDRLKEDIDFRIQKVLNHGQYILGPEVIELEEKLANYVGVDHCITCGNGTDALQISLMAIGVGAGDEVITPAFSYIATASTISILGATPVYVDIDPKTFTLDPKKIENAINSKTAAIIPVSLYGQVANFDEINKIGTTHNIPIIEDGAQSFGGKNSDGSKSCAQSIMGCTSFFPSKPLGCYGDGGAVFTNDKGLATIIKQIARHGQDKRYNHIRLGINSRLDTIQAAVLLSKLTILDEEISLKNKVASNYNSFFKKSSKIIPPFIRKGNISAWGQYTVRLKNRDHLHLKLKDEGIMTAIHYPRALNRQPAVANVGNFKESDKAAKEVLSLPISPYLKEEDQNIILDKIEFFS